jgi:3-deoxy-7-phosphoheptulonate synthase
MQSNIYIQSNNNININNIKPVNNPQFIKSKSILNKEDYEFINDSRETIKNILDGKDDRLLVVVGPCSIHNYNSAIEYASLLSELKFNNLFIVMRVYFEKPRTSVGWKGFIYDPDLDNSNNINKGLSLARSLLEEITKLRIPIGVEFLDTITPQYLADLVSWGAIGARTTESQIHRQLASGLSMPIGFKNLTDGNIEKAINGIKSANNPHTFLGIDESGIASIVETKGNNYSHLILRGGNDKPNYDIDIISNLPKLDKKIIIDCSHDNSCKNYKRQELVALYVMRLKMLKGLNIGGIMIESNINEGKQELSNNLKYGVSITDGCISFITTLTLLNYLDNMEIINIDNIDDTRKLIEYYDTQSIANNSININLKITNSNVISNVDDEIMGLNMNSNNMHSNNMHSNNMHSNMQSINILLSTRLAISEKVADLKLKNNPELFLRKSSNILEEITKISLEEHIIKKFKQVSENDNIHKILDISKKIQVNSINKQLANIKIGYLFGKGTFSYEAVSLLRGNHNDYKNVNELYVALDNNEIDFAIIPVYNIKIGTIYVIPEKYKEILKYSIPINLSIYTNKLADIYDTLYVEPHVEKEVDYRILETLRYKHKENTISTREGILQILNNKNPCLTIASSNLNNPLITKISDVNDESNRTYFAVIKKNNF